MRLLMLLLLLSFGVDVQAEPKVTGSDLIRSQFSLTTHQGKPVTDKDFHGQYLMVYFGFSNCAKICPVGLRTLAATVNKLAELDRQVTPLFITVDPERDTVERLANYVTLYDPKLIGLTGDIAAVDAAAKSFRAYYGKIEDDGMGNYSFDHSGIIYLIGKQGEYLGHFSSSDASDEIAAQVKALLLRDK